MFASMEITGRESAAARALLNWTLNEAANASGVGARTISNFEGNRPPGKTLSRLAMNALIRAYQDAGIEFVEGGVALKKRA